MPQLSKFQGYPNMSMGMIEGISPRKSPHLSLQTSISLLRAAKERRIGNSVPEWNSENATFNKTPNI